MLLEKTSKPWTTLIIDMAALKIDDDVRKITNEFDEISNKQTKKNSLNSGEQRILT